MEKQHTPKNNRESGRTSSSGLLIFIITFLVVLVILIFVAWKWLTAETGHFPFMPTPTTTATTTTTAPAPRFTAEDRFAVAVYITDNSGALQTATIVAVQPEAHCATVSCMPAELAFFDTDYDTLSRRFAMDGIESAHREFGTYFGQPIDYYAVMSYNDVQHYFERLNESLIITLDKNVDQQPLDGSFSIHLTAGQVALTPQQVANLFRCDNWQGGIRERASMHAKILSAYVNQFVSLDRDMKADFNTMQTVAECNLTGSRFGTIIPALEELAAANSGTMCSTLATNGDFSGAGALLRFTPSSAMVSAIKDDLRPITQPSDAEN